MKQEEVIVEAEVADFAYGGRGVARVEGRVVFIAGAVPGDRVRAKLIRQKKSFAEAEVVEVLKPSPMRVAEPTCQIAGELLPGCPYALISDADELQVKDRQLRGFLRHFKGVTFLPPWNPPRTLGYRNKMTLHVGASGELGYLREPSHTVLSIDRCPLSSDAVNALLARFRESASFSTLRAGEQIVFRATSAGDAAVMRFAPRKGFRPRVCPLFWDEVQDAFVRGLPPVLHEQTEVGVMCVAPDGFWQVHGEAGRELVRIVGDIFEEHAEAFPDVLDLYCGVGVFALALAQRGAQRIFGVESFEPAVRRAQENARQLGIRATFRRATLGAACALGKEWMRAPERTTVVVDPPRGGMDAAVIAALSRARPGRVIYVSCDPATLARDLERFAQGGYRPQRARLLNLFPQTARFESVVELEQSAC